MLKVIFKICIVINRVMPTWRVIDSFSVTLAMAIKVTIMREMDLFVARR